MSKLAPLLSLLIIGCATDRTDLMKQRQMAVDAIADRCGAPRDSWKLTSEDTLLFYFPDGLEREKRLCLIHGLRDDRVPVKFAAGDSTITVEEVK